MTARAVSVSTTIAINPLPLGSTIKPMSTQPGIQVAQSSQSQSQLNKAIRVKQRLGAMEAYKTPWLNEYRLASEYVLRRKYWLSGYNYADDSAFITTEVFDATAPNALSQLCSSLIGALWPNGSRSVQIRPPLSMAEQDKNAPEIKEFYEYATQVLTEKIDHPRSGFRTALEEYMADQGTFGVSGIGVNETEDDECPMSFIAVDAKRLSIAEGADGYIDTVYIRRYVTVRQMVEKFGIDKVSERIRQLYNAPNGASLEEKTQYIEAIEPRMKDSQGNYLLGGFGNMNMPIGCIYIENDSEHVLKESGYDEMTIFVTRFSKRMNEVYGRSPAMESMPDILEINSRREMLIVADEKMLNPPLALYDDGQLGGGTLNTSAGSVSIFHVTGRTAQSQKVIDQIVTIGDMQWSYKRVTELTDIIRVNFYIDRLTDFNNDTRMTLGEAKMRDQMRTQALNAVYSRQQDELFNRLVSRCFNICFNRNLFGYAPNDPVAIQAAQQGVAVRIIPQQVLDLIGQNKEAYHAEFISPAARSMKAEELNGIQQTVTYILGLSQSDPTVVDNVNLDKVVHKVQNLSGAPADILRSDKEVADIRASRAAAQQKSQQIQEGKIQSETVRAIGQGAQAAAKAGIDPMALGQQVMQGAQQQQGMPANGQSA